MSSAALHPTAAVQIRRATPADTPACGQIFYEAFAGINQAHGFPPEIPNGEVGGQILNGIFSHPGFYPIVAEADGEIVGSNALDERSVIAGVGPITIAPQKQNCGIGRLLMDEVLRRAAERQFAGVRLVQAAFHARSLCLYTKLGFDVREPLSIMTGLPLNITVEGCAVRPAAEADIAVCNALCLRVHGHDRHGELRDGILQGAAMVVERHGRITGYASGFGYFGHAVGETNLEIEALLGAAQNVVGVGVLVPTRNAALFRWCLDHGMRVLMPTTLMTKGLYNEPAGAYLPSILF